MNTQKEISFRKLSFEALPEMWTFQILTSIVLGPLAYFLSRLIHWVAGVGGKAVTTANIGSFFLSWRFPVILFLGILLVSLYLVLELLAMIFLTDHILKGQKSEMFRCIGGGFRSLRRFLNPAGIGLILITFIAVPICGVGFSLSLSESFYIPNFIMEVVLKNPLYAAGYGALILFFIWIVWHWAFVFHAVLLDGMTPAEGRKYSARLVKEHRGAFLKGLLLTVLVITVVIVASNILLALIPGWLLGGIGESLPKNYRIDFLAILESGKLLTETDANMMVYRIAAAFAVLAEKYLFSVVTLLCGSYFLLRLNRYYLEYTGRGRKLWPERPKKARYIWKILLILAVFLFLALVSVGVGLFYNNLFTREEPVGIVAHRAGGTMASENSLEGVEKAIEHGCYASEIDVQRTKDGYYIINHDNDFGRLTGVAKAPSEMTLEEIRKLRIRDTAGSGQELLVPTLEEMLEVCKGRIRLFVELKGKTADRQMVDDVVRIIREHDCLEDTALISLNYDIIDYAETAYPEFETGTLFFASLGDVSNLNCDLLIMEEETATDGNISSIHDAGKEAIVWTVNTEKGMYHFLDTRIDAVITDEILLAEEVQAALDDRTDLEVLEDKLTIE